jgi:DNA-directed RNA polymerase subunit RPC12/RpoP
MPRTMSETTHLKMVCERCGEHIEYPSEMAGQSIQCPACQHTIKLLSPLPPPQPPPTIPQPPPVKATIERKSSLAGIGCLLQGLGAVCFVLAVATIKTAIGPVIFGILGLWLLFYGSRKATWLECSLCGGKLSHQRVSICPHCNASFR